MTRRRWAAGALLLYLGLAVLLFWNAWTGPPNAVPGVAGDAEAHMWWLRWIPFAISHLQNPFFTDYIGYPQGVNVMWSNANVVALPALLLSPISLIAGVITAYRLMATLALALSAWCAYLACNRYVDRQPGAILGGLLYGFSPYMAAQSLGHIGLTIAVIPPLMMLTLDEILVRRRRSYVMGVFLGLLAAAQLLTAEELLATEAIAAAVALAVLAVLRWRQAVAAVPTLVRSLAVAAPVFAAFGAAPLSFQFLGTGAIEGLIRQQDLYVTDLWNFVLPTSVQLIHPAWSDDLVSSFTGNVSEWNGYIGLGLIVVVLFTAIWMRRRPVVLMAAIAAVIVAVLSMGPHLHAGGEVTSWSLLWQVDSLPLLQNILPSRVMLYFFLFAGVVVAIFVDEVMTRNPVWLGFGAVVLLATFVPLLPAWPYPSHVEAVPEYFSTSAVDEIAQDSVALVLPFARSNSQAMLWQAESGMRFRMPEGNFVASPVTSINATGPPPSRLSNMVESIQAGAPPPVVDPSLRAQAASDMENSGIHFVIVGPMDYRPSMIRFFSQLYNHDPAQTDGVAVWRGLPAHA